MAITKAFGKYAVDVDDVLFDQITDMAVTTELAKIIAGSSGTVYNQYVGISSQQDGMTFSTSKLSTTLAKVGLDGLKITTGAVVTAFFQQFAEGGTFEGALKHVKIIGNEGIIVPRTLTVDQGGQASLSYEALFTFDGTNEPLAVTKDQTVAGSPTVAEMFDVGPVKINGSTIEGIQSINIDFGIELEAISGDGEGRPTYVRVISIQPIITITTTDIETLQSLTLLGVAQGATDSVIYLRKYQEDSGASAPFTHMPDATEEHVSFTVDQGHIHVSEASASGQDKATATIIITPTYDDVNAPVVIDLSCAIV